MTLFHDAGRRKFVCSLCQTTWVVLGTCRCLRCLFRMNSCLVDPVFQQWRFKGLDRRFRVLFHLFDQIKVRFLLNQFVQPIRSELYLDE